MSTRVVDLKSFAQEIGKYAEEELDKLKEGALAGIAKSIPAIVEASPVDTGLYAQSWGFSEEEWGAVLGNTAPHAPIIEEGARPFTPPIYPLLAWAKRVLKDPSQPPEYSPAVWALARGTQKKIARVGMAPRHIMRNAIPMVIENIKAEWEHM